MSGYNFKVEPFTPPESALACVSNGEMPFRAKDIIYLAPVSENESGFTFDVFPQVLNGSQL
jgi:hypothetical protein